MTDIQDTIRRLLVETLGLPPETEVQVGRPPRPEMGDYAVPMFPFAKVLRDAPPRIAARVVEAFEPGDGLASAEAAGPFVNFRVDRAGFLGSLLETVSQAGERYGHGTSGAGRTVVIDYSSPNISKHLAFHHIRSTMIGHSLDRLHEACGWRSVALNFLGDWGTTHGMLLAAWERWGDGIDLDEDGVTKLNALYVRYRKAIDEDAALEDEARAWFKRLEEGDELARRRWERFRAVSLAEFEATYERLGVSFDAYFGESFYEDRMEPVLEDLAARGLTTIDDGALVVELEEDSMPPCLLRKRDGTTLYATRDIASAIHRYEEYEFDRALYVVGKGQSLHFRQWFRVCERAGYPFAGALEHVSFGQIRFGGEKVGTRKGNVVRLAEVLDRARDEIRAVVAEKNPDLPSEECEAVAEQVGVGAIVFANVARDRERDWDFDWERLLSFEGDTGPYCQYQHARIASVVAKSGVEVSGADPSRLSTEHEWQLGLALAAFPEQVERACERCDPSIVASYVLDLCRTFSSWYAQGNQDPALKVNCDDADTARARLALAAACAQVVRNGLHLLGLSAPERM